MRLRSIASLPAANVVALGVLFLAASTSAQPRRVADAPAQPPPAVVDPVPGPFVVNYDWEGKLTGDAEGIIANAARSWMIDPLDTYTVCFQAGADKQAWRSGFTALKAVAEQIKSHHGAAVVVTLSGGQCPGGWSAQGVPPPYVYIMGAVRL